MVLAVDLSVSALSSLLALAFFLLPFLPPLCSLRADPANVSSASARKAVVDDVLQTLELSRIAERSVSTLSAGELKRLSLGVELCANTGLVFADGGYRYC